MTEPEEFCSQCYGKGWVRVAGKRRDCIACWLRRDRAERGSVPPVENRFDRRQYDNQTASHLRMPNGSLVASFDAAFLGAAGRSVLALHGLVAS